MPEIAPPAVRIPIARPLMGDAEVEAAARAIRSGWVTQGPEVQAFEHEFALAVGTAYGVAVSSCTAALHLALTAVGVKRADEVVTVSCSYIATANSIRYCGAGPVFVDVHPSTYNMDPACVEQAISERTRAILAVHQMGMPCDLRTIVGIARERNLIVIEDAACAIGSKVNWEGQWDRIGKPHGDIACFSFHPRKLLSTGDGGMITTQNAEWDEKLRLLRQHGMSVSDAARHGAEQIVFESYPVLGYNYRMTDIQAAIGREQLRRLPEVIQRRRYLAERYHGQLARINGLSLPEEPAWARSNWQSYCVRLPDGCDQRTVMQHMLDAGIATRRGIMCAHREDAYPPPRWRAAAPLRNSESIQDRCIILPLFHQLTEKEQDMVVTTVEKACAD